jgi:D-aspartate ligase
MGDMDLLRPLSRAGIPCAVVAGPEDEVRFSRFARAVVDGADHWLEPDALVERLLRFAAGQPSPPVLMYQTDGDLLLVSRRRDELADAFRFVVPDAQLVEQLVDKWRFASLAALLGIPVPRGALLRPRVDVPAEVDLRFPLVVKPITRQMHVWGAVEPDAKALHVATPEELERLWPELAAADDDIEVLAQEVVPGPEDRIESYHAYVDARGEVAGEFTGRKIRTNPPRYGHTTALEITDAPEVAELGREVLRLMRFTGVAKIDFKRDDDGRLKVLEVNPRFNLWHNAGAAAGVNLPALVYADLTGTARPPAPRARAGVTWCLPWLDAASVRAGGGSLASWLPWALRCDTMSVVAPDDPLPLLRGKLWSRLRANALRRNR